MSQNTYPWLCAALVASSFADIATSQMHPDFTQTTLPSGRVPGMNICGKMDFTDPVAEVTTDSYKTCISDYSYQKKEWDGTSKNIGYRGVIQSRGTCYFAAASAAIAAVKPTMIPKVAVKKDGVYRVTFHYYEAGSLTVVVDGEAYRESRFQNNPRKPNFRCNDGDEFARGYCADHWYNVLVDGFAKYRGLSEGGKDHYAVSGRGGSTKWALATMTGSPFKSIEKIALKLYPTGLLFNKIKKALDKKTPVIAETGQFFFDGNVPAGISNFHGYAVIGARIDTSGDKDAYLIKLWDPNGKVVEITTQALKKYYETVAFAGPFTKNKDTVDEELPLPGSAVEAVRLTDTARYPQEQLFLNPDFNGLSGYASPPALDNYQDTIVRLLYAAQDNTDELVVFQAPERVQLDAGDLIRCSEKTTKPPLIMGGVGPYDYRTCSVSEEFVEAFTVTSIPLASLKKSGGVQGEYWPSGERDQTQETFSANDPITERFPVTEPRAYLADFDLKDLGIEENTCYYFALKSDIAQGRFGLIGDLNGQCFRCIYPNEFRDGFCRREEIEDDEEDSCSYVTYNNEDKAFCCDDVPEDQCCDSNEDNFFSCLEANPCLSQCSY